MDNHSSWIHQTRLNSSLYNLPPWANAWISLSVATPSGFSNNQPSWSQSAEFFVCTRVKTVVFASNWSRISTATSLTSDCKNICPNQPVKKFERNCLCRQSTQVGVTRQYEFPQKKSYQLCQSIERWLPKHRSLLSPCGQVKNVKSIKKSWPDHQGQGVWQVHPLSTSALSASFGAVS